MGIFLKSCIAVFLGAFFIKFDREESWYLEAEYEEKIEIGELMKAYGFKYEDLMQDGEYSYVNRGRSGIWIVNVRSLESGDEEPEKMLIVSNLSVFDKNIIDIRYQLSKSNRLNSSLSDAALRVIDRGNESPGLDVIGKR